MTHALRFRTEVLLPIRGMRGGSRFYTNNVPYATHGMDKFGLTRALYGDAEQPHESVERILLNLSIEAPNGFD